MSPTLAPRACRSPSLFVRNRPIGKILCRYISQRMRSSMARCTIVAVLVLRHGLVAADVNFRFDRERVADREHSVRAAVADAFGGAASPRPPSWARGARERLLALSVSVDGVGDSPPLATTRPAGTDESVKPGTGVFISPASFPIEPTNRTSPALSAKPVRAEQRFTSRPGSWANCGLDVVALLNTTSEPALHAAVFSSTA